MARFSSLPCCCIVMSSSSCIKQQYISFSLLSSIWSRPASMWRWTAARLVEQKQEAIRSIMLNRSSMTTKWLKWLLNIHIERNVSTEEESRKCFEGIFWPSIILTITFKMVKCVDNLIKNVWEYLWQLIYNIEVTGSWYLFYCPVEFKDDSVVKPPESAFSRSFIGSENQIKSNQNQFCMQFLQKWHNDVLLSPNLELISL